MSQVNHIRSLYYSEGRTISQIARETKLDRKTIRSYIEKEDWNITKREVQNNSDFPKLNRFKTDIDEWLLLDKKAKYKQRHTAKRVFVRLQEKYQEEFDCSYRTVAAYFLKKKKEVFGNKKAYLPLEHVPGEAQVDFGDADFCENGRIYSGKYLNISFPYSNKGYLQLFRGENQECLFEGLIAIFEHIEGIPYKIWFDNASTMVSKVLNNGERKLTESFLRFALHYRFEYVFCNVNAGNEKGSVENKVGYHRRNMLVPVPSFMSLSDFNQELFDKCELDAEREHYRKESTIQELYSKDKESLLGLPSNPLDVSAYKTVKTNGYGRFYLNSNLHEYSVSPKYANSRVLIKITANEVIALDENQKIIIRHERLYGQDKQQSMKWLPYLTQLSRHPGALKHSGIYQLLPKSIQDYLERQNKSDRGKILQAIATLTQKSSFEKALASVEKVLDYEVSDADSLINLHNRMFGDFVELEPIHLTANIPSLAPMKLNLSVYDAQIKRSIAKNVTV